MDGHLLIVSPLCPGEGRALVSLPPLIRTQLVLDWGPILGPRSTLLISLKAVISKYSHIGGYGFSM